MKRNPWTRTPLAHAVVSLGVLVLVGKLSRPLLGLVGDAAAAAAQPRHRRERRP